jgi:hypothetical protein
LRGTVGDEAQGASGEGAGDAASRVVPVNPVQSKGGSGAEGESGRGRGDPGGEIPDRLILSVEVPRAPVEIDRRVIGNLIRSREFQGASGVDLNVSAPRDTVSGDGISTSGVVQLQNACIDSGQAGIGICTGEAYGSAADFPQGSVSGDDIGNRKGRRGVVPEAATVCAQGDTTICIVDREIGGRGEGGVDSVQNELVSGEGGRIGTEVGFAVETKAAIRDGGGSCKSVRSG